MGETASRKYPYPETSAVPNVPADIKALAEALDTSVTAVVATADAATVTANNGVNAGTIGVKVRYGSANARANASFQVALPAGVFTATPIILLTVDAGSAKNDLWHMPVVMSGTTKDTLWVGWSHFGNGFTTPDVKVNWLAVGV